jgi:hypothetical protein
VETAAREGSGCLSEYLTAYLSECLTARLSGCSDLSYRGEACQHLDLDLVDLEVKGHFRIRKVQPEACSRK